MQSNSLDYQKSIAREFDAYKNRVRNLIGSAHWGEEGRYKEIILMNFLRRFLPNTVAVGTGFIKNGDKLSNQIDIIIYNPSLPIYFKESDFIIVQPSSVLAIIEVKSNPDRSEIGEAISKATKNGKMIEDNLIFNGVFIYGVATEENGLSNLKRKPGSGQLLDCLKSSLSGKNAVNHIVDLNGIFIKRWNNDNYRCYSINDLSVSYFFSNLLEMIDTRMGTFGIPEPMRTHLYPLKEGKKSHLIWELSDCNEKDS